MDPHPLVNLFKRSNYDEPIASELTGLDYLYEILLKIHESENCDGMLKEETYKKIHPFLCLSSIRLFVCFLFARGLYSLLCHDDSREYQIV